MEYNLEEIHHNRTISRIGVTFINVAFFLSILGFIILIAPVASILIVIVGGFFIIMLTLVTLGLLAIGGWTIRALNDLSAFAEGIIKIIIAAPVLFGLSIIFMIAGWFLIGKDEHWVLARKARKRINVMIGFDIFFVIVGAVVLALMLGGAV